MSEILDKLSSYNIFNYLFPGVVFVAMLDEFIGYSLIQENLVIGAFVYYFIGLIISRFGSLVIEPILKKVKFLKFVKYTDFIIASKNDLKIEAASEVNNMYRTICSMFILFFLVKLFQFLSIKYSFSEGVSLVAMVSLLLIIFIFSYKKQTGYVVKRVEVSITNLPR